MHYHIVTNAARICASSINGISNHVVLKLRLGLFLEFTLYTTRIHLIQKDNMHCNRLIIEPIHG